MLCSTNTTNYKNLSKSLGDAAFTSLEQASVDVARREEEEGHATEVQDRAVNRLPLAINKFFERNLRCFPSEENRYVGQAAAQNCT